MWTIWIHKLNPLKIACLRRTFFFKFVSKLFEEPGEHNLFTQTCAHTHSLRQWKNHPRTTTISKYIWGVRGGSKHPFWPPPMSNSAIQVKKNMQVLKIHREAKFKSPVKWPFEWFFHLSKALFWSRHDKDMGELATKTSEFFWAFPKRSITQHKLGRLQAPLKFRENVKFGCFSTPKWCTAYNHELWRRLLFLCALEVIWD